MCSADSQSLPEGPTTVGDNSSSGMRTRAHSSEGLQSHPRSPEVEHMANAPDVTNEEDNLNMREELTGEDHCSDGKDDVREEDRKGLLTEGAHGNETLNLSAKTSGCVRCEVPSASAKENSAVNVLAGDPLIGTTESGSLQKKDEQTNELLEHSFATDHAKADFVIPVDGNHGGIDVQEKQTTNGDDSWDHGEQYRLPTPLQSRTSPEKYTNPITYQGANLFKPGFPYSMEQEHQGIEASDSLVSLQNDNSDEEAGINEDQMPDEPMAYIQDGGNVDENTSGNLLDSINSLQPLALAQSLPCSSSGHGSYDTDQTTPKQRLGNPLSPVADQTQSYSDQETGTTTAHSSLTSSIPSVELALQSDPPTGVEGHHEDREFIALHTPEADRQSIVGGHHIAGIQNQSK